ncbi:MAG: hypothetical protein ACI3ZQ_09585 [Candidatus Cryptobacteroides sp.]
MMPATKKAFLHTSPAMLKKYIKAGILKVVEKFTDKSDYFK